MNTIISIGDSSITDAHCWLSEKNISKEKIKTQKKYINKEHISFKNNIHYWIQRSADETRRI
ncbi:MAG: hypothetical protein JXK07_14165 [Spirochaetes bacterium]|nr:hypothetical protein [Spirochaetota bacterium]